MGTAITSNYDDDEFLHPLWLGILMLLTVITVVGLSCLIRKNFGSQIRQFFNRLSCISQSNSGTQNELDKHTIVPNPYNRAFPYMPPNNASPKINKLLRNIKTASFDKKSSPQSIISEDNDISLTDKISVDEERSLSQLTSTEKVRQTSLEDNKTRGSEAARKFYASMRDTSLCKTASLDSHENPPRPSKSTYFGNSKRIQQLKLFHTPHFFQSITNGHE